MVNSSVVCLYDKLIRAIELLPDKVEIQEYIDEENEEFQTFFLEALQAEDSERAKRQALSVQSFNVVLGAILGFLSASAASLVK